MEYVSRAIRYHRRTIFVLAVIAACFLMNYARTIAWSNVLAEAGIRAEQGPAPVLPDDANSVSDIGSPESQLPEQQGPQQPAQVPQKEAQPMPQPVPRQEIRPDYSLPATAKGEVPVIQHIPTKQKVVFLTIDDGMTQTPDAPRLFKQFGIKIPMFLNSVYAQKKPGYFLDLTKQGMVVGSHTVDHKDLTELTYDQQVEEICTNAKDLGDWMGQRPTLFRPPYGSYNKSVVHAAAACGMRALVMWSAKANGGSMQYQDGRTGLVPGDIVLMHFRPEFAQDFKAFIDAANAAGLQPENLDDWLQPPHQFSSQSNV